MDLGWRVWFGLLSGGVKFEFCAVCEALFGERDGLASGPNLSLLNLIA
nr:hypothetical protein [uncultured Campylobacter sp.]